MDQQISFLNDVEKKEKPLQKKISAQKNKIVMYTDGASRGNPGASGAGVFATKGDEAFLQVGYFIGKKTNNQAEYLALLLGLLALQNKIGVGTFKETLLTVCADSELLVRQMSGIYKVKNPVIKQIKEAIDSIIENVRCTFRHVVREKNKEADALANMGIDKNKKLPLSTIDFLEKHKILI
jgi:ribonuclease HI